MKRFALTLACLALSSPLFSAKSLSPTAEAGYRLLETSPTAKPKWKDAPFVRGRYYYVTGKSSRSASLEGARKEAVKDAASKAAEFLENKGFGKRYELAQGVE